MILGLFKNEADVFDQMNFPDDVRENRTVVYAQYEYEDYSGSATVIYLEDGKLYQINASHCSCYGLEEANQDGEEIDFETLKGFCDRGVKDYDADYNYVMEYLKQRNNEDPTDLEEFFRPYQLLAKLS